MQVARGIQFDITDTKSFMPPADVDAMAGTIARIAQDLDQGKGPGAGFLGWRDLPAQLAGKHLAALERSASRARGDCEAYVVVGIGGSYLGARAVLEALEGGHDGPDILFAGSSLSSIAMDLVLRQLKHRDFRICVISKSGTTLEPAVAFRLLRVAMKNRYGAEEAARRTTAITDARRGALHQLAKEEGYETFVIPDDVGGRFSVLTPVGLLPLAVAGVEIRALAAGAQDMRERCRADSLRENPARLYAALRHGLYQRGFRTEILSSFDPRLEYFQEWWKQLFGESEGKDGKGIYPSSAMFTTDLHSLGQYIQEGRRELLETFLFVRQGKAGLTLPAEPEPAHPSPPAPSRAAEPGRARAGQPDQGRNLDGLDYLVGKSLDDINAKAYEGTRRAHGAGGVPCLALEIDSLDERVIGGLITFFEEAVAISGRLLEVNPFNQPGVEAYKKEMFKLLGKP
jgi:glucose-6-phosphate isomerase